MFKRAKTPTTSLAIAPNVHNSIAFFRRQTRRFSATQQGCPGQTVGATSTNTNLLALYTGVVLGMFLEERHLLRYRKPYLACSVTCIWRWQDLYFNTTLPFDRPLEWFILAIRVSFLKNSYNFILLY